MSDLAFGYRYSFYTRARDLAGNIEPIPDEPDAVVVVGRKPTEPGATTVGGVPTITKGLRLLAVPIQSQEADPKVIFKFEAGKWARWDPVKGEYVIYDNDPEGYTRFAEPEKVPGRGYWAFLPQDITPEIYGMLPDDTEEFIIPLKPGWNQIGNPWLGDLVWDVEAIRVEIKGERKSLKEAADIVEPYIWRWDGSEYQLVSDSSILPGVENKLPAWEGAWIFARKECGLVIPSPKRYEVQ